MKLGPLTGYFLEILIFGVLTKIDPTQQSPSSYFQGNDNAKTNQRTSRTFIDHVEDTTKNETFYSDPYLLDLDAAQVKSNTMSNDEIMHGDEVSNTRKSSTNSNMRENVLYNNRSSSLSKTEDLSNNLQFENNIKPTKAASRTRSTEPYQQSWNKVDDQEKVKTDPTYENNNGARGNRRTNKNKKFKDLDLRKKLLHDDLNFQERSRNENLRNSKHRRTSKKYRFQKRFTDLADSPMILKRRRGMMPKSIQEKSLKQKMKNSKSFWKQKIKLKPLERKHSDFLTKQQRSVLHRAIKKQFFTSDRLKMNTDVKTRVEDNFRRKDILDNIFRLPWENKNNKIIDESLKLTKLKSKNKNWKPETQVDWEQTMFNKLKSKTDNKNAPILDNLENLNWQPIDLSIEDKTPFYAPSNLKPKKRSVEELRDMWQNQIAKMDLIGEKPPPKYYGLNDGEKLRQILKSQFSNNGKSLTSEDNDIFGFSVLKHLYL